MAEHIQVVTTTETKQDAETIARALLEGRLAACVQIVGPVTSVYWWKEAIEAGDEWQCVAKTRRDLFDAVAEAIRRHHPYEVPEILATPVAAGSESYLAWLDKETRTPPG